MTHTRTTVTLDRSDWRRVLCGLSRCNASEVHVSLCLLVAVANTTMACMERGITVLASQTARSQRTSGRRNANDHTVLDDYPHVQDARWGLHDHIEEQVDGQYDGEPQTLNRNVVSFSSADHSEGMSQTLDDMIVTLEDELDMSRSIHAEELGRKYAHLRD